MPNISNHIKIINDTITGLDSKKSYHGFIGVDCRQELKHVSPMLAIFPTDVAGSTAAENKIHFHEFIANPKTRMTKVGNIIFCGPQNGIIYETYGKLYQSKFENMQLGIAHHGRFHTMSVAFNFKEISDGKFAQPSMGNVKLQYIGNNQIFAVMNAPKDMNNINRMYPKNGRDFKYKCGIFDIQKKFWT